MRTGDAALVYQIATDSFWLLVNGVFIGELSDEWCRSVHQAMVKERKNAS